MTNSIEYALTGANNSVTQSSPMTAHNSNPPDTFLTRNEDINIVKLPPEIHYEINQTTIANIRAAAAEVAKMQSSKQKESSQLWFGFTTTFFGAFLSSLFSIGDSIRDKQLTLPLVISFFLILLTVICFFLWILALKDVNNVTKEKDFKIKQLLNTLNNGLLDYSFQTNTYFRELAQSDNVKNDS